MKNIRSFTVLITTLLAMALVTRSACGQTSVLTTLHTFTGQNGDGANPHAGGAILSNGNFYGTTSLGGGPNRGTAFSVSSAGTSIILYTFTTAGAAAGGYNPESALLEATDGSFVGATDAQDGYSVPSLFRFTSNGAFTVLHSFQNDDRQVKGKLVQATDGSYYGTASPFNPSSTNEGTIFRLSLSDVYTEIYTFTGPDGALPVGGLVQATDGSFYGTTSSGGVNNKGTVFRIISDGTLTTIYSFSGTDGNDPEASLIQGADGNFYGTTVQGGVNDAGTIFSISPSGTLITLHSFTGGTDGAAPYDGLIQGSDGNFYGTTRLLGGSTGNGTIFQITSAGTFTTLYAFTGGSDGNQPNGIVQAPDGSFYGTTRLAGNNNGQGTVFRFGVVPAGTLQFSTAAYNVNENAGVATITVSRANGSTGAVSISYATANGTASDGTDYTAESGTLAWADGDTTDKTFQVPITDRHLTTGNTVNIALTLSAPTGGAVLGLVSQSSIVITQNEVIVQPTVSLTSPPNNLTVVAGAPLPLAANVNDPSGILSQVQFQIDGQQVGSASSTGPYVYNATAPTTPGAHQITVIAVDNQNRQNSSSATVTVVAADASNPAPSVAILTSLDQRSLAAGSSVTLDASAATASGAALQSVSFYADGTLFASFDGAGNVIMSLYPDINRPTRRDAPSGLATNTVFQATYQLPGTAKIVNLIAVALDKLGQSTISSVASIHSTVTKEAPTVLIAGLANGTHVQVGSANVVTVSANESTTSTSGAIQVTPQGVVRQDASGSATLALLEYFLNGTRLAQATQPPFTFSFTPPASGEYVLSAVATDSAGVATVSAPVTVVADPVASTVNLALGGTGAAVEGGANGIVLVTRTGGDNSAALTVSYKAKGAAKAGVDYKTLSGTITIPAGAAKAKIKIKPLAGLSGEGTLKLKLQLIPPTDGSYVVGSGNVKIKLVGE